MQAAPYRSCCQQGKSTEVRLVHLSSYKQGLALESVPDVTIICTGLGFSR